MPASLTWLARGEHELPDDISWLTPGEAERAAGMRFPKQRTEYLLRRWVGKQAVAAALDGLGEAPDLGRIGIANRPSGAPYVVVDGAPSALTVSLTDRAGWGVCLVGPGLTRVGCDLEVVESRSAGFVSDFLTEGEQAFVASQQPGDASDAAANLLWSAKESGLKVLQTGLRRDTRSVEVSVEDARYDGWGRLTMRTAEGRRLPGWWRREGVFLLTLAADSEIGPPRPLPGSAQLSGASPVHSWVGKPLAF
jgi:4'-phosphopantetheinyl transferase